MLLKQFPDIEFVRRLRNDPAKPADTWMNVALNVKCKEVSRTGVESPYSIFINNKGFSYCSVNKMQYRVENSFLFTQPGEQYDLVVDNPEQTELCNIHINRDFFHSVSYSLINSSSQLLTQPFDASGTSRQPHLFTQLYPKDDTIKKLAGQLCTLNPDDAQSFEMVLANIIEHLLLSNEEVRRKIAALPFLTSAVKTDIYKRISLACDYLFSNYDKAIRLDDLCMEIGMSKFHFLRIFRHHYKMTPYQYLTKIRMDKAAELLRQTNKPISEIADCLGFEYPNSFIKTFKKTYGNAPLQYRRQ